MTHSGPCWRDHDYRKQTMTQLADLIVEEVQVQGGTVASYQLLIGQMRSIEYLLDGMPVCSDCLALVFERDVLGARGA